MYKKVVTVSIFFCCVWTCSICAKINNARNSKSEIGKNTSSASSRSSIAKKNSVAVSTKDTAKDATASKTPQEIEKSCQERFNDCMDNVCINEQGIRYNCSSSYDSFDTITKNGNSIRVGSDLYTYAKGSCLSVLKSCDLKDRNDIENQYKAQIQTDFLTKNYMDAMAYSGEAAATDALKKYIECMSPLCGNNFKDCFTISAVERRASQCESVLSSTGRPLAVKKAFYEELENMNKQLCLQTGGYIDFDKKICKVEVIIGKPKTTWKDGVESMDPSGALDKEFAKRHFNVGEIVECTQEYFSTFYEENEDFAKGVVKMAAGITKAVAGVVVTVVGAVATAFSGGAAKGLIGSGIKMTLNGTANTLDGYTVVDSGEKKGACYINNKYVAPLGQYFKINFMQ